MVCDKASPRELLFSLQYRGIGLITFISPSIIHLLRVHSTSPLPDGSIISNQHLLFPSLAINYAIIILCPSIPCTMSTKGKSKALPELDNDFDDELAYFTAKKRTYTRPFSRCSTADPRLISR